jgi:hypothetical protein
MRQAAAAAARCFFDELLPLWIDSADISPLFDSCLSFSLRLPRRHDAHDRRRRLLPLMPLFAPLPLR